MKGYLAACMAAALFASTPTAIVAATKTAVFKGKVVHVSTDNIKVNDGKQTLSFLLVPKFNKVFSKDGKTTTQMSKLTPGTPVAVYYDQKALGARHADRIVIMGTAAPGSSMKS
jgi:hypothetical protein